MSQEFKRLYLDAGHGPGNGAGGSFDPGATFGPYTEYALTDFIASALEMAFKHDIDVHVMRVPEAARSKIVEWVNGLYAPGDAFLSLHMNAAESQKARGCEVIIASRAPEREAQARRLVEAFSKHARVPLRQKPVLHDSETPRGAITVLRGTKAPAFLLEMGFLTNQQDRLAVMSRGICGVAEGIRALAGGEGG